MFAWTPTTSSSPLDNEARLAKRAAMYRRELEAHAALLLRLGRTPAFVKSRLSANVTWDFELQGKPLHAAEVDRIVDSVARRRLVR